MKSIDIVVLNWNTPQLTINTVKSLLKVKANNFIYKILIIDNGSTDNSVSQFRRVFNTYKNIFVYNTGSNLGYVDGNNYGINIALKTNPDYILIVNSDVIVKPDFLQIMFEFLESHYDYGLVGPKIYFAPGFEFHKQRYLAKDLGKVIWSAGGVIDWDNIYGTNIGIDEVDIGQFNLPRSDVDYISGCCLLVRKEIFIKFGPFDSRYFMYLEDDEFSKRLVKNGIKIAYLPDSIIWHINAGSAQAGGGPLHDYFLTRNRLLFGFTYAPLRTKLALFRDSIRIYLAGTPWQKRGVIDFYLHKFGKGSWS